MRMQRSVNPRHVEHGDHLALRWRRSLHLERKLILPGRYDVSVTD